MEEIEENLIAPLPASLEGKRIVIVNHGDMLGDSAKGSFMLMQALRRRGLDVRMLVYTKSSDEENVAAVGARLERGIRFCLERLDILLHNGFDRSTLFEVSTGRFAIDVSSHPWVMEADIVCLNWINQGLLNLKGIRKLHFKGKRIVWMVHDMWPFTGVCHHSGKCDYYTDECGNCMYLRDGGHSHDLSRKYWRKKRRLYGEVPITFITQSRGLERRARKSSLLRGRPVTTIQAPLPIDQFYTTPPSHIEMLLPTTKPNLILMGANRLDDESRNLSLGIDALNRIFDNHPDIASDTMVYLFGDLDTPRELDRLRLSHRWFGRINDQKILRYLMSSAKVILSTSMVEHIPTTLLESMASGAVPVTFDAPARNDLIKHLENGYLAQPMDAADLSDGILWALGADISREQQRDIITSRYSSDIIAEKYIDLFAQLVK